MYHYVNLPLILTEVRKYFEILIFMNFLTVVKYFGKKNISALSGRHCGPHPSSIK